jgi:hypothetical protein
MLDAAFFFVMPGLDPGIHLSTKMMDCRVTPLCGGPAMTNR